MVFDIRGPGAASKRRAEDKRRADEDRLRAATVTGTGKIFNDAALCIEKLSGYEHDFQQYGSFGYFKENMERGLASLSAITKELPEKEAELCRDFGKKTKYFILIEEQECKPKHGTLRLGDLAPEADAGPLVAEALGGLVGVFEAAGKRGEFYELCDSLRDKLRNQALSIK